MNDRTKLARLCHARAILLDQPLVNKFLAETHQKATRINVTLHPQVAEIARQRMRQLGFTGLSAYCEHLVRRHHAALWRAYGPDKL